MMNLDALGDLIAEVEKQRHGDFLHSTAHAVKVALIGLQLADLLQRRTTGSLSHQERVALVLFGLLHDSRLGDHWSRDHGPQAASYARSLDLRPLRLSRSVRERLYRALRDR